MQLDLSDDQAALLSRILDAALKELRVEVRRTDTRALHDELQREEEVIRGLLVKLGATAESS